MYTQTTDEATLCRDLAVAYPWAARRCWAGMLWTHMPVALPHAQWVGNGRTPEGQDEWPA